MYIPKLLREVTLWRENSDWAETRKTPVITPDFQGNTEAFQCLYYELTYCLQTLKCFQEARGWNDVYTQTLICICQKPNPKSATKREVLALILGKPGTSAGPEATGPSLCPLLHRSLCLSLFLFILQGVATRQAKEFPEALDLRPLQSSLSAVATVSPQGLIPGEMLMGIRNRPSFPTQWAGLGHIF